MSLGKKQPKSGQGTKSDTIPIQNQFIKCEIDWMKGECEENHEGIEEFRIVTDTMEKELSRANKDYKEIYHCERTLQKILDDLELPYEEPWLRHRINDYTQYGGIYDSVKIYLDAHSDIQDTAQTCDTLAWIYLCGIGVIEEMTQDGKWDDDVLGIAYSKRLPPYYSKGKGAMAWRRIYWLKDEYNLTEEQFTALIGIVTAHEIGHLFGLSHHPSYTRTCIMTPEIKDFWNPHPPAHEFCSFHLPQLLSGTLP